MKDSINVVEAIEIDKVVTYKLTTTVMLDMNVASEQAGATSLAGSLTRQVGRYQCCNIIHTLMNCDHVYSFIRVFASTHMPIQFHERRTLLPVDMKTCFIRANSKKLCSPPSNVSINQRRS